MPIYEYVCTDCGEPVERLQKLSDPPLTDCPACGQSKLKRKVSAASFRLSGTGWYETDFKSGERRNVTGSGNGDNSKTADKATEATGDASGKKSNGQDKKGSADHTGQQSAGAGPSAKQGRSTTQSPS
jgi:putative FmdB family regulatory protein